jgi:hypothetical protein
MAALWRTEGGDDKVGEGVVLMSAINGFTGTTRRKNKN